jgi:hypothetical protein
MCPQMDGFAALWPPDKESGQVLGVSREESWCLRRWELSGGVAGGSSGHPSPATGPLWHMWQVDTFWDSSWGGGFCCITPRLSPLLWSP